MSKIGLMGGSFDPVHLGHIELIRLAIEQLSLDNFMFIPVANNPWKKQSRAGKQQRLEMLEIATSSYPNVSINTMEIDDDSEDKNYTINTLKKIKQQHPNDELFYIMGMDQASQFDKWKCANEISQYVQLVAFQRTGYKANECITTYPFITLNNTPNSISSSAIRDGNISYLDPQVLRYISNHGIYLDTMLKNTMSKKRFIHTKSMANLAKEIAKENNLDPIKAYIAGMFHDIAKEMTPTEAKPLMETHFPNYIDSPFPIWHQWLSAYIAKEVYLVEDEEILQAIRRHTNASTNMSKMDMCIYVSDKYDPSRGYEVEQSIALCKQDVVAGFTQCLKEVFSIIKQKNIEIDSYFYKVYTTYTKEKLDE